MHFTMCSDVIGIHKHSIKRSEMCVYGETNNSPGLTKMFLQWHRKPAAERYDELHSLPYKSSLWSVDEMPPVGCVILPANVFGVMPQSTHLHRKVHVITATDFKTDHWYPDCSPPVQECCPYATEHSWGFLLCPWSSWRLWAKHQRCQRPWRVCPPSRSVWSASTSLHKSARSTGSRTQSLHSRRLCRCSRTSSHWSPRHWTHRNLWWCQRCCYARLFRYFK